MNTPYFHDKAATLASLEGQLTTARVLPQTTIRLGDWRRERERLIAMVLGQDWATLRTGRALHPLIVRSSALGEDGVAQSMAGHYVSVADVTGAEALGAAVDTVFASYGEDPDPRQRVLIQPLLDRVVACGVATSREIGSGRPYIVVDTHLGADTAAVTAGRANDSEVVYHFRGAPEAPPGRVGAVVRLMRELESLTETKSLDIEFAFVEGEHRPVLLQARPLAGVPQVALRRDRHCRLLARAEAKIAETLGRHPVAGGRRSALGVMPDWNPAEMIGVRPRPLALSLYRGLITDEVWAHQRTHYGYRDLRSVPLLIDVLGLPYIDVRASFDSFVPAALPDETAAKLVDHSMARLLAAPALHDKIEFEIVLSCYSFDLDRRLEQLNAAGFTTDETDALRRALHALTGRLLDPTLSPRLAEHQRLAQLAARRTRVLASDVDPLAQAYVLLEDAKHYGARAFAGLARLGFIAVQMLNALVEVGAISAMERQLFFISVSTVASDLQTDLVRLSRDDFLDIYGHLRPGAYDILSPRYDEAPALYFGAAGREVRPPVTTVETDHTQERAALHHAVQARIAKAAAPLLRAHGFDIDPQVFVEFLAGAIREREEAKFLFTRNLSDALVRLRQWGQGAGFSLEDLSYADARVLKEIIASARTPVDLFAESIRQGRDAHEATLATALPPLIVDPGEVWTFQLPLSTPNYVTSRAVQAAVAPILDREAIDGRIVLIPNADPGFDWIFAHNPAGLVTAFGGVNSHMAIRAAELDLPAVIGAGERLFREWSDAPGLRIDCANRRVEVLPA